MLISFSFGAVLSINKYIILQYLRNMQKLTISCLAFLAVVCLYANSVSAIKCNQCKDPTDKKCSDTKSVDCDKGDDTCITMTITQGDSTEINKGCGNSPKDSKGFAINI